MYTEDEHVGLYSIKQLSVMSGRVLGAAEPVCVGSSHSGLLFLQTAWLGSKVW